MLTAGCVLGVSAAMIVSAAPTQARTVRVLRVGTWHGVRGTYPSIQAAVDAAHPGDWVLVGPGDWKERGDYTTWKPSGGEPGWGVTIKVPHLHLRGMNRNSVVVDGTKPGSPQCSNHRADQDFGPLYKGKHVGRSGIVASKVDGVSIDNLTACNFLGQGNQIWWNGGDGSGKVGMGPYSGSYLSATTTYFNANDPQATYGIFVSNARGPALITRTYASNMNDAAYYIGACADCGVVLDRPHAENSALGYSGTNSGGHLIIQNGEWDDNATGIVSNSQNNDDSPSPQDGACPSGNGSCEIWRNNYVHDNNNPNVPEAGSAAAGPVGTGMVIAGGRNDTLLHNRVTNNKAWGILTTPYPDTEVPPSDIGQHCQGGAPNTAVSGLILGQTGTVPCYFSDWGNEIAHNSFAHNGGYGNPTNGDIADISHVPPEDPSAPGNCWHNNKDTAGPLSMFPTTLGATNSTCGQPVYPDPAEVAVLTAEVSCDSQLLFNCAPPPGVPAQYPQTTKVRLKPLPHEQTMPDPCKGVPTNPWCPRHHSSGRHGSTQGSGSGRTLSDTGLDIGVPIAGLLLLLTGLYVARLRRRES
ncbi:MAG: hypothetical protein JO222_04285 [Frankiales bacterium]|nr:hypothetical protein [Frankiales bacterium]